MCCTFFFPSQSTVHRWMHVACQGRRLIEKAWMQSFLHNICVKDMLKDAPSNGFSATSTLSEVQLEPCADPLKTSLFLAGAIFSEAQKARRQAIVVSIMATSALLFVFFVTSASFWCHFFSRELSSASCRVMLSGETRHAFWRDEQTHCLGGRKLRCGL